MDRLLHDLKPVDSLMVGAEGPPGQREFFLQARKDSVLVTLLMEKEQVALLCNSILNLLADIEDLPPIDTSEVPETILEYPSVPLFRVRQMGLGYEKAEGLFALFLQGMVAADEDEADMPVVRIWATGAQMQVFSDHALQVVEAGRPICPLCQEPIDPDGHLCPRSNGHADPLVL